MKMEAGRFSDTSELITNQKKKFVPILFVVDVVLCSNSVLDTGWCGLFLLQIGTHAIDLLL